MSSHQVAERHDGTISLVVVVALAVSTVMAMLIVDLAAWGLANARAQAAADASALAAVVQASSGTDGRREAQRVAHANGATLVTCRCDGRDGRHGPATAVSVTVATPISGFVMPLVGFERVHATASATMVGQPVSLE